MKIGRERGPLRTIRTLYGRELVHLVRDRHTLIYSIAIPIFLYPTILFCVFQSMSVIEAWTQKQVATLGLNEVDPHPRLRRMLEAEDSLHIVSVPRDGLSETEWARLDASLTVSGDLAAGEMIRAKLVYSSVRDTAPRLRKRVEEILGEYRSARLLELAASVGESDEFLEVFEIEANDVATGERKANYLLSMTMPLLMVVIILMGAFYPALDATAGERERSTLETTLLAPVSRISLVVGKYLAVVTLALMAFSFNFLSMGFSFKHVITQANVKAFTISFPAIVVIAIGAVLLAALVSAIMMAVAFVARSFKEGQSYMAPVYLLGLAPVAVTMSPQLSLSPILAIAPVVNVTMLFREVLQGRFDWPLIGLTIASSALWTALAIALSAWLVSREGFLLGDRAPAGCTVAALFRRMLGRDATQHDEEAP